MKDSNPRPAGRHPCGLSPATLPTELTSQKWDSRQESNLQTKYNSTLYTTDCVDPVARHQGNNLAFLTGITRQLYLVCLPLSNICTLSFQFRMTLVCRGTLSFPSTASGIPSSFKGYTVLKPVPPSNAWCPNDLSFE